MKWSTHTISGNPLCDGRLGSMLRPSSCGYGNGTWACQKSSLSASPIVGGTCSAPFAPKSGFKTYLPQENSLQARDGGAHAVLGRLHSSQPIAVPQEEQRQLPPQRNTRANESPAPKLGKVETAKPPEAKSLSIEVDENSHLGVSFQGTLLGSRLKGKPKKKTTT